jgi:hypothetical protein
VKRSGYKINAILVDQFQFQTNDSEVLFNLFFERKMNLLKKVKKFKNFTTDFLSYMFDIELLNDEYEIKE